MRRLVFLPLLVAGCFADPTFGGRPVVCESDADCATLPGTFRCTDVGLCVRELSVADAGEADGGDEHDAGSNADAGADLDAGSDADAGSDLDAGAADAGPPKCPDPCAPPTLVVKSPNNDEIVGALVTMKLVVTLGDQLLDSVFCHVVPMAGEVTYAVEDTTPGEWTCTLDLSQEPAGSLSLAATVRDIDGRASTEIVFVTKQ